MSSYFGIHTHVDTPFPTILWDKLNRTNILLYVTLRFKFVSNKVFWRGILLHFTALFIVFVKGEKIYIYLILTNIAVRSPISSFTNALVRCSTSTMNAISGAYGLAVGFRTIFGVAFTAVFHWSGFHQSLFFVNSLEFDLIFRTSWWEI